MKKSMKTGIRLYRTRRYEQALQEFQSVELDPADSPELSYYLGLCYTQLERFDEALLYLEQVVTSSDNLLQIYQSRMILSYIYTTTKRFKLARFELGQLLVSGYESAQVYAAFGYVAYMLGETEESLEYLQKAVTLDPRNTNALNSIGFILAEKDIDPEGALSYCKNAVQLKPENAAYLDSLGWAYFKIGKLDEAKSYLRKALNLSGGNKEIASHMKATLSAEIEAKRRLDEEV
ncbi:MAG TPA: tetratricopeptide repeat protein [Spirochaetia bacterium]|nr:tetratricopeptide repeat protein [Spirochaetia bacterium]